jgi:class 3 adenylate cyclase
VGVLLRELDHVNSLTEQGDARAMARRFLPAGRTSSEVFSADLLPKKPVHVEAIVLRAAMAPVGSDAVEPDSFVLLQDAFISRVQAVVCQNGGMLEWAGGPAGVKAIFGYPQGKPDLSAIRAALALQRETYAMSLKARLTMGLEVGTRVSMEVGDLVVGMGGTGCQLHLVSAGAAADVASRLTGFTEPGEILIGPAMLARYGAELLQGRTVEMRGAGTSGTSVLGLKSERGPKRIEPTRAVEVVPARVRHFRSEFVGEGILVSSVQSPEVFLVQLPQTDLTTALLGGELIHVELGGALFGPEVSFLASILASDVADPSEDGTVTLRIQIILPRMLDMA